MLIDTAQIEATKARYFNEDQQRKRARNERLMAEGRYLEIDEPQRVDKFLARHGFTRTDATLLLREHRRGISEAREPVAGQYEPFALERVLGTSDLLGVAFLERGLQVARSIGRIWISVAGGRPGGYGTGFLISPRLLITNHHVLPDVATARQSLVEFDYQLSANGILLPTTTFSFNPDEFFLTDQHLDYAVVAVRSPGGGGRPLSDFGWNPLIEEQGKAIVSQWLNIIQHPNGEPKQLAFRENQLVDVLDEFLHYKTDTAPGSSGSPVYNDRWEVVSLHHSGVWATNAAGQILAIDGSVWREEMGEHRIKWVANEGVRVSTLVAHLRQQSMDSTQRRLFDEVFQAAPPIPNRDGENLSSPPAALPATQMTVANDGSVTWTIPLSVSVRLGGVGAPSMLTPVSPGTVTGQTTGQAAPITTVSTSSTDLNAILEAARRDLGGRADVVNIRLGYVFKDGWITGDHALVVTVRQKLTPAKLRERNILALPEIFMGLPVEVTNPSISDLVRLARGPAVAEAAFSDVATMREEITYTRPAGVQLDKVTDHMRVIAHVSPDAGWPQLSAFLAGTREQLVIGMYDFGAPHIANAVEAAGRLATFQQMTLVMQKGESLNEGTKADDLHDAEVVQQLQTAVADRFQNAWVKIGRVNGWVASSYHIKVAVRDQSAVWLSSGNWQSSNQPAADPLGEHPPQRKWLDQYNREWHIIVEHVGLAKVYAALLKHDFENNVGTDGHESLELPDLFVPEAFFVPAVAERTASFKYFQPFEQTGLFTVQPLLTPDNYHQQVLELIESAQEELLIQNQTFNAPKEGHDQLRELIDAVLAKQRAGVEVKVIFRVLRSSDARENLENLKDYGFDMDSFKVQKNCHTKGIVVDRKKVLLGSQNWSNDGVSVNRDASLLFDNEALAQYFATIFDHDWSTLAKKDIGSEALPIESAHAGQATPPGMIRLTWKDYMEML